MPESEASLLLSLTFAGFYLLSGLPVKATLRARARQRLHGVIPFYLLSPVFVSASWRQARTWLQGSDARLLWRSLLFLPATALALYGLWALPESLSAWRPFLALVPFYLVLESVGVLLQAAFGLAGYRLPDIHRNPLASTSLSDFWGRRWNRWVGEWLRGVGFTPYRRHPAAATMLVFLVSGLWHEFTFNLPYFLNSGRALFGDMTCYFLLQGAGVLADHHLPRHLPVLRRAFAWAVVVGPAPLVLNEATLRIFFLLQP